MIELLENNTKKKVMLIYPPGRLYQRGEDRSQGNIENSTATTIRAPNDLGYGASTLKAKNFEVFLKDYQTEKLTVNDLASDLKKFNPDVLFVSITNATIFTDIEIINNLKKIRKDLIVILKGALFFNPEDDLLKQLDLENIDYLVGGECEFVLADLVYSHFNSREKIPDLRGILYKKDDKWLRTDFSTWETNLDSLMFPDRSMMNNSLYIRPDTGDFQATIATSRGCPSACIFCVTPNISGKNVRSRSPQNIVEELKECYFKYNISNFFFKSDTFTIDKNWVKELCEYIINSELNGKISWVANSRANPIEEETLVNMKKAGCWLVAFGFESGSPETLKRIKKGTTCEQAKKAVKYAKKAGLMTFGFYLIGLPWENWSHLKETKKLMFELNTDFVELHLAVPYYGTELYQMAKEKGIIDKSVLGKDYFNAPTLGTEYLKIEEIEKFKKNTLLQYHLRPSYIVRKLFHASSNFNILKNYLKFGTNLIKQALAG